MSIPHDQLAPLADAIGAAYTPGDLDMILWAALKTRLHADYVGEGETHKRTAYLLLQRLDQLGHALEILREIARLSQEQAGKAPPQIAAYHAAVLARLQSASPEALVPQQVAAIAMATRSIGGRLDHPAIRALLTEMRSELGTFADTLVNLEIYKQLHDCIHHMQIKQFHSLNAAATVFTRDPLRLEILQEYLEQLRSHADDMASHIARLPEAGGQRAMESRWHGELLAAIRDLQSALDGAEPAAALIALRDIQFLIAQMPNRLNMLIVMAAGGLRFDLLDRTISQADSIAPGHAAFRVSLQALRVVAPTLQANVAEHNEWQRADKAMAALESLLEAGPVAARVEFFPYWSDAKLRLRARIDRAPQQEWAVRALNYMDDLDDELAGEADDGLLKRAFSNLRREARIRFYSVDLRLKDDCERLVQISDPIRDVLARLNNG